MHEHRAYIQLIGAMIEYNRNNFTVSLSPKFRMQLLNEQQPQDNIKFTSTGLEIFGLKAVVDRNQIEPFTFIK